MQRFFKVALGISFLGLIAFFYLIQHHPPRVDNLEFTSFTKVEKNYVEYTEGALRPRELPYTSFASEAAAPVPFSTQNPIILEDGHEAPSGNPIGIARIGSESFPVYYSTLKFFRHIDEQAPVVDEPSPVAETTRRIPNQGLEVREIPTAGGLFPSPKDRATALAALKRDGYMPALLLPSGERVIPTGELNVIPDPSVSTNQILAAAKNLGMEVIRRATTTDEWWLLKTSAQLPEEIYKAANALVKVIPCRFAEPNWIREVKKRSVPKDTLFPKQWHLKNTGQTSGTVGSDISAEGAWAITTGNPKVIVSIFDDGFDIGHADLPSASAFVFPHDFIRKNADPRPADNDKKDPDNHGTSTFGLMSSPHNGIGVSGVSPGVKFMPLRNPIELDERGTADGIRWAADHGAHVMSNSWGYSNPSAVVTSALAYARKSGRGGKGTLVFFASGNENANIGKTNDLSNNSSVVAIGATTHQDRRTTYSNYGDRLFACAPAGYGASVGLVTTDRTGAKGYSATSSYTEEKGNQFDGTSGACPIAAGIAALVFSVNPDFTVDQVEEILRETADKVQSATAAYDASGHSTKYGYGRLNARAAVERAKTVSAGGNGIPTPTTRITGTVKNKTTGKPVSSAIVTLSSGQVIRGSEFNFDNLPAGTFSITAASDNYKSSTRALTLTSGQSRTINFSLVEIPLPSIVATVRKINSGGNAVYAQGVTVSISGPATGTAKTGWGETAGKAKFYDLPAGRYTVSWNAYTASTTVVLGQTAYLDLGESP